MIRYMKGKILLLFILLIWQTAIAANANKDMVNGDIVVAGADDQLTKLLNIPGVQPLYDNCKKTQPTDIPTCLWTAVSANTVLQKQVLDAAKANDKLASPNELGIAENFSTDPALQKLGDIMKKKLNEALYGDPDYDKKTLSQTVDQKNFNDIYRTELSKTMVDAFLSYCLDTVPSVSGPDDFKTNRANNVAKIKSDPKSLTDKNNKWDNCIRNISDDCKNANTKYQKDRACLVIQYVEASKKNIKVLDTTDQNYFNVNQGGPVNTGANFKQNDLKSLAALTTVTSKDIDNAYKDTSDKANKDIEDCLQKNDDNKCKEFLSTNTKSNQDGVAEFTLRQLADKADFDNKIDAVKSKDDLAKFLSSRGYSDEAIKEMDLSKIEDVKAKIKKRYENEKTALISDMNKRVEAKTSKNDGNVNKTDDSSNLINIQKELESRNQNMQDLTFFDNVVSAYLTAEVTINGKKVDNPERNTASLAAELNNNDNNIKFKQDLEKLDGKPIVDPNANGSGTTVQTLDVDKIIDPTK